MPIKVPVVQTGLEQSIQQAAQKAGKSLKINMGPGAKSIESLSQPLGRLTGKADDFTKSMAAANARVLAFGASVGTIAAVTRGMKELVTTTIEVEKSLANINSILKQSESQLNAFKSNIFDIARNTEQSFANVAEAALELSRQGLKAEQVTQRLNDALILSRLSGMNAADSVSGLTAAINSFKSAGLTSAEVLNKISAAAASAAVSDRDLIEGLKRSGAVAVSTGVEFDELIGIISALQEKTARGGSVIGNSLKTIFVRIQDLDRLQSIQRLGVEVTDLEGKVLSSNKIIENLAPTFAKLDQASRVNLADNLVGKFQIAPFLALLEDYNQKISRSNEVASTSFGATNEAYERNEALNISLSAAINKATLNLKELANTLGEIGVTDNLKNILGFFNSIVTSIQGVLDGDGVGSSFAKGLIKGISNIISGPGLALALAVVGKLLIDFGKFGAKSLSVFFGLNKAAERQAQLQGQIASSLINDKAIRKKILDIERLSISAEEKKVLQAKFFTTALNEQLAVMTRMQGIAATIAPSVMAGTRSGRGRGRGRRAAGGFLPVGAEKSDISRGVGGAPSSAKPVVIPNFAFGGGKRGTMVANSSEYIVPNYANGGDAIFNQNMASSMGLPANAKKVRAASGYVPNFASVAKFTIGGKNFSAAQITPAIQSGKITQKQASDAGYMTSAERKALQNKRNKKSTLSIPARIFGVASMFSSKKSDNSRTSPDQLTHPYAKELMASGVKNIKFNGIQIKSLDDLSKNAKITEKSNRTRLGSIFATPLVRYAQEIMGKTFGNDELSAIEAEIKKLGRSGGTKGARLFSASAEGGILESAMSLATKGVKGIKDFKSDKEDQIPFDFEESGIASSKFKKTFGFSNKLQKADAKRTASNEAVRTVIAKAFNDKSSRRFISRVAKSQGFPAAKAAGGYIPNFAGGALEEAVGREKAAGLPVSQIRINQSSKLRNSQNPMGLAVTNTRDEPTGAIPNFAKGNSGQAAEGLTNKLFALQSVMFLFQSGVGEMAEESSGAAKVMFQVSQAAMQLVMALTAMQALGGLKGVGALMGGAKGRGMMLTGRLANRRLVKSGATGLRAAKIPALANSFKIFGGLLLKLVAPLTILAAGFGAIVAMNEKITGSSELNKKALDMVTRSSKSAAKNLSKINVGDVEEFKENNQGLASSDMSALKAGLGTGFLPGSGHLQGASDAEKFERIKELINNAYDAGSTQKQVRTIIDSSIAQADGGQLRTRQTKSLMTNLASLSEVDRSSLQERFEEQARKTKDPEARKKLAEDFKAQGLASELVEASTAKVKLESEQRLEKINGINLANAKARLQTAIEVRKENFKLLTDTDKRIMKAEALGGLDDNSLLALKQKAKQQELLNGLASKNLDFINSQGDELTRLKLEDKQISDIENEILNISAEDLANKDKVLDIVNKIYQTNGLDEEVAKSLVASLGIQLDQNEGIFKASQKTLTNRQDETKELTKQKQLIKEIEAERSLAAQTIQFGKKNESAGQRSSIQATLRNLGVKKQEAESLGQQGMVQALNNQIAALNQSLARVSGDEGQAGIDERFRTISFPDSIKNMFSDKIATLTDPRVDAIQTVRGIEKEALDLIDFGVVGEEFTTLEKSIRGLENEMIKNKRAEQDGVDAAKNLESTLSRQAEINTTLSKNLAPFSRSESASASRLAIAQGIVEKDKTKSLPLEVRRLEMERGAGKRISESRLTELEISNNLSQSIADASLTFKDNLASGISEALSGARNLSDVLRGAAVTFLDSMNKAFMNKAVDSIVGSFASGGPITGGSGHKDDVPAMLMGGEFVMNKKAVSRYGMGFMSALNSGSIQGFASGGQVRDKEGMFTTPGINGAGSISGGRNLLSFATQTPVALARDSIKSFGGFLGSESGRMTNFGRRNNPEFQRVQAAKKQAFDLYAQELNAEMQAREQGKANKKSLTNSLIGAAASGLISAGVSGFSKGFGVKLGADGQGLGFGKRISAGFKTAGSAYGDIFSGAGQMLSGGFKQGFSNIRQGFSGGSFIPQAIPVSGKTIRSGGMGGDLGELFSGDGDLAGSYSMVRRKATGGLIPAAGGVDTVPAMLSGGEFVMNAAATQNIGASNLQALNSGAGVRDNSDLVVKLDELIRATEDSQAAGNISITVNGSNGSESSVGGQGASEEQRNLSEKIKIAVKQVIADEKRLGGQLRR